MLAVPFPREQVVGRLTTGGVTDGKQYAENSGITLQARTSNLYERHMTNRQDKSPYTFSLNFQMLAMAICLVMHVNT